MHPVNHNTAILKPRYAVGVSVLLTSGGRLLLGRRKNNKAAGWLSTPGGRLEPNESIMDCARREFREETGAELASPDNYTPAYQEYVEFPRILDVKRHERFDDNYVMIYVHATNYIGTLANPEPDKCEGWNWYEGYNIADRDDVTEPPEILKQLPLTWIRSAIDQARIDGYNEAINDVKERIGHEGDSRYCVDRLRK